MRSHILTVDTFHCQLFLGQITPMRMLKSRTRRRRAIERLEARCVLSIDLLPLKDINTNLLPTAVIEFEEVGPITYFVGETSTTRGLWKTDGTDAGTVLLRDFDFGLPTDRQKSSRTSMASSTLQPATTSDRNYGQAMGRWQGRCS